MSGGGRVFYTSDPHFGHAKVAGLRGFDRVEDHDLALFDAWERDVREEDLVYVLGDLAMSSPTHALAILDTLPGRKRLVWGNHDRGHPMYRDAHRWEGVYREVFGATAPFYRRKIAGRDVFLSHFPYSKDRGTPRFLQYRLRDEGAWLLHGHTHGPERLHDDREVHVGFDAWRRLVSQDEIAAMIEGSEA